MIGGALDTFPGAGIRTCRKLIDEGTIRDVTGTTAFLMSRGPEGWHPDPAFFYKNGDFREPESDYERQPPMDPILPHGGL